MSSAPHIAEVAALVGDPARANILCALLDGRALTATELAFAAGVSPQTTSAHSASSRREPPPAPGASSLLPAGRAAGRADAREHHDRGDDRTAALPAEVQADDKLRSARTCYDHIAGMLGVGLAERLRRAARRARRRGRRGDPRRLGVLTSSASTSRRRAPGAASSAAPASTGPSGGRISAARSARRSLSGASSCTGSSGCATSRALTITPAGRRGFHEFFALSM